nr:hypothetical protein [Tanacetum cinerariifolium]
MLWFSWYVSIHDIVAPFLSSMAVLPTSSNNIFEYGYENQQKYSRGCLEHVMLFVESQIEKDVIEMHGVI